MSRPHPTTHPTAGKPTTSNLARPLLAALALAVAATVGLTQTPPQGPTQAAAGPDSLANAEVARLSTAGAAGKLIGFSSSDGLGTQTITLVHAEKSWIAVYHIDRSGQIRLVSSRPIDADFSLQLNATSPLPEDIRELGRR